VDNEQPSQPNQVDYDRLADEYAHHRTVQPEVLKQLLSRGEINATSRVLEVGCGTGNYIAEIQSATRCRCWGIDPSISMLTRAKEKSRQTRRPFSLYFPGTVGVDLHRYPTPANLQEMMAYAGFKEIGSAAVEFSFLRTDIQDFRDKAYSCLHLIPEDEFERGITQMKEDLRVTPILWNSRYLILWGRKNI
jgi:SAM-dependent methyltransferase